MKYIYLIIPALLVAGCKKKTYIEFTGVTPGIKNGVFIIKNTGDSAVYGENIKNGKFELSKQYLQQPGYYTMNITDDSIDDHHEPFEVYLEDGKYTIETEAGKLYKYPTITSPSKIQDQLSAFYTLSDKISFETHQKVKQLNAEIKSEGNSLSAPAYTKLLNKLTDAQNKMSDNDLTALKAFVKQYPNSPISAHLMAKLNYEDDPAEYFAIYKTFSPVAKNSDDGKDIGDKLNHLVKLVAGAAAPAILGKMPDGKPFDKALVKKKMILIDFWRSGDDVSRRNHQQLTDILNGLANKNNLGIVSISLDTRSDWWISAVSEDHMTWPQVSDLKGDDSPNATNWSISEIPTYYLLDGSWHIIERNIDIGNVDFEVKDYIRKHPNL